MLAGTKLESLNLLIRESSREELIWINGYVTGLLGVDSNTTEEEKPATSTTRHDKPGSFTILYGTETGNSQKLAFEFGARIKSHGIGSKIKSLDQYRVSDLEKEQHLLLVVSTHGEGDPPAAAKKFYDHLHARDHSLSNISYSVFALGDSAYPLFCKAGDDIDKRLNHLGAKRINPIAMADTDFELVANEWIDAVIEKAVNQTPLNKVKPSVVKKSNQKRNYEGRVFTKINLNDSGSAKETWHIEIGAEVELDYAPGDALGIIPHNSTKEIERVLTLTSLDNSVEILYRNETYIAFDLLQKKLNIHHLPIRVIQAYAQLVGRDIPDTRMDFSHLLKIYPPEKEIGAEVLFSILEPIVPRLYSIASAKSAHGGNEVHITVAKNSFYVNNDRQTGLCSSYLSLLDEGDTVDFYIQKNHSFKLPAADKDIILIGPGTGIAPFRSFLHERETVSAPGKNWLFFGDQHFTTDFLYQAEIQSLLKSGTLTRFNGAFSRDQEEKIYVQHKMKEHATELFRWVEGGAHLFVCGAKEPMSGDVERCLIEILGEQAGISTQEAQVYLDTLKESGRYHKDVY